MISQNDLVSVFGVLLAYTQSDGRHISNSLYTPDCLNGDVWSVSETSALVWHRLEPDRNEGLPQERQRLEGKLMPSVKRHPGLSYAFC